MDKVVRKIEVFNEKDESGWVISIWYDDGMKDVCNLDRFINIINHINEDNIFLKKMNNILIEKMNK